MLDRLFRRHQPVITVDAEGEELVFRVGEKELRQVPALRIAEGGEIVAVGRDALDERPGRLVHLFRPEAGPDETRAFFRQQLRLLLTGISLRPRVLIHERPLRRAFGPDAPEALRSAVTADGFAADFASAM